MIKSLFIFSLFIFSACSSGKQETIAHIIQRRVVSDNKLMVSYQFHAGNQLITDSMEVPKNRIVPHDSVKLVFSPENPAISELILP